MKIGILISAAIIAIITAVTIIGMRGVADRPHRTYSLLEARTFSNLSPLVDISSGDASAAYEDMINYYKEFSSSLDTIDDVPADLSERAIDFVIKAHEAGTITSAFIDKKIPMTPNAKPDFGNAFQVIGDVAMARAEELRLRENADAKARAEKAAKAVFAMGYTLFEKSKRVPIRTQGIAIMTSGGTALYNWSGEGNEFAANVQKWTDALNSLIEDYWKQKSEVVYTLRLNTPELRATIGNLLEYAYDDKDYSWRIEAILALGRVKYMPNRGKGNDRAVRSCIEDLKGHKDPMIAEAAAAADKYTREDVKQMN